MPSISESRKQVKESLRSQRGAVDHDAVLASLQDEIDKHNSIKEDAKPSMRDRGKAEQSQHLSSTSSRLRFRDGAAHPKERRPHRSRHEHEHDEQHRTKRKRGYPTPPQDEAEGAHPFPREPTDPGRPDHGTDDAAFRESLFDALADDEGAAYWESVYSQPIHVYSRPTVQTEQGDLEQMSDEQYTAYVKTKMWEKKNPEIVLERERTERKRREKEEAATRRKEEFVRKKEQAAWDRAQRRGFGSNSDCDDEGADGKGRRYRREFAGEKDWHASTFKPPGNQAQRHEYAEAWTRYLAAWDKLKKELLDERQSGANTAHPAAKPSKRIPWPTLASKPAVKANIEDFMRHAPASEERSMAHLLKAERVRWHPDKVQQRFGSEVDEGTMKVVTGVFQVVDGLLEEERKNGG